MKFVLVLVLLTCALSLTIKERMATATVEELLAELETVEVLTKGCAFGLCGANYCCRSPMGFGP